MPPVERVLNLAWSTPRRATITTFLVAGLLGLVLLVVPAIGDLAKWLLLSSPFAVLAAAFPNQAKQVGGAILAHAGQLSHGAERQAVKQDLEGTLTLGAERLSSLAPGRTLAPLRIDYLRSGEEVERLADGAIVVGIANHKNRDRNLAIAAWTYVRHGVLAEARPFVDPDVSIGLDGVLAKEMLAAASPTAVREFLRAIWNPAIIGNRRAAELGEKLDRIQEHRLLGPIVMSEFQDLATSLGFRLPSDAIARETARFVEYLYGLTLREPGEDVGDAANFDGDAIRCRVVFVGRPGVYSVKGPNPHRKAIDWALRRAYHRVYLLGLGSKGSEYVSEVADPYRLDRRIANVEVFAADRRLPNGRHLRQTVARLCVDVRYGVTIGQRPLVAVGPGHLVDRARTGTKAG